VAELTKKLGGRPRLYSTPEEFDSKVEQYQDYCEVSGEPVTWTGLALFMGFAARACIDEYANYDGFSYSVKRAKTFVEWHYEMRLCGDKPTGAIFALKNFGWQDKSEVIQDIVVTDGATLAEKLTNGSKR
jgi:hypothetical protein